jgi:Na+/H+ antiporter NhaD/arsenite permease-like protein
VTVVAELAAEAGVFAAVAERLARVARGRAWLLWLLVVALAVVCTAFLSLDTTAVLLTPWSCCWQCTAACHPCRSR